MAATLTFESGPEAGRQIGLWGEQLLIGRDPGSDVVIGDAAVSRHHAQITYQAGRYIIEDLASTNGTFVNGRRLAGPANLRSGDLILLGESLRLRFHWAAPAAAPPPPVAVSSQATPPAPPPWEAARQRQAAAGRTPPEAA
ncbi:MAG: FHA domain-containing protein, partial [Candidatus Promineifilaceae bacterium]